MSQLKIQRRFDLRLPFVEKSALGAAFEDAEDGGLFIEGVASAEMEDTQGEILKWDGIKRAFGAWQGNVIQEHAKASEKTIGTRISAAFDEANKRVTVRAFIAKSATTAIDKIRSGVLKAFSVQGSIPRKAGATRLVRKSDGSEVLEVHEWKMDALAVCGSAAIGSLGHFRIAKEDAPQEPEEIDETAEAMRQAMRVSKDGDEVYSALSVLDCGQGFIREISFLRAYEGAEMPAEPEQLATLDAAIALVKEACGKVAAFLGMEAAEITKDGSTPEGVSLAAMVAANYRASKQLLQKSTIQQPAIVPAFTPSDGVKLAKALGETLADGFESLSKDARGIATAQAERFERIEKKLEKIGKTPIPDGILSRPQSYIDAVNKDAGLGGGEPNLRQAVRILKKYAKEGETISELADRAGE